MTAFPESASRTPGHRVPSDVPFYVGMAAIGGCYVLLIVLLLVADAVYVMEDAFKKGLGQGWGGWVWAVLTSNAVLDAFRSPAIRDSIVLSLISCTVTSILSIYVAVPLAYLLARHQFPGRALVDALLDIPIVLPPLVVGLSLLILFQYVPRTWSELVVYEVPAVILAQFAVAAAFAVRTLRATFDQIDARREQVALTLGCSRWKAFSMVVMPEAWRGILTAQTVAWARALGEFGPLLVFAGTTRHKTEVLSTTVFLELNIGELRAAVAVSLIMVVAAIIVLVVARVWGTRAV